MDAVPGRAVHFEGSETHRVDTTGRNKSDLAVVLAVEASEAKSKPLLNFKKKLMPAIRVAKYPDIGISVRRVTFSDHVFDRISVTHPHEKHGNSQGLFRGTSG